MGKIFNPPPNWPEPPAGWTPPPGWQPDPSWGPVPEGHQLWIDDAHAGAGAQAASDAPTAPVPALAPPAPEVPAFAAPDGSVFAAPASTATPADTAGFQQAPGYPGAGYPGTGYPGTPGPGAGYPGYPGAPAPVAPGKGLAISALVVAIVALLLCWIPFINTISFILGLVALGLAIAAIVITVRRKAGPRGLAIAGAAVAAASLIGTIVTQAIVFSALSEVSAVVEEQPTLEEPSAVDGMGDEALVESATEEEAAGDATPLPLGESATIGDYDVAVTSVVLNANEPIAAANQFNEAPTGQFVLIELTVTYNGVEEGNPWIDLAPTFVGSDARQYDSCPAVLPKDAMDVPTLEKTGSATYQECFDVPAEAIQGGTIFLEPLFSLEDTRVYWSLQ